MEKRYLERKQFYEVGSDKSNVPIWVFEECNGEAIPGLLLDISKEGAQILIDKSRKLDRKSYLLTVHSVENSTDTLLKVKILHCWSKPEGTQYERNGFEFDEKVLMKAITSLNNSDFHWYRCELLPC
jgi:hypothetical protein